MKKTTIIIITIFLIIKIFLNYNIVILNINEITNIFITNIFPPLFLFFVISSILVNYGFIEIISNTIGIITSKLFKISKYSSYIFFMSILSGFPSSAKYTKELLSKKLINETEATKVLMFSHFANPLFILTMVPSKALLIIFCHYITNIVIGILFRNYLVTKNTNTIIKNKSKSLIETISKSIIESLNLLLGILGIIVIFYSISSILNNNILKYLLEMSSSINYINAYNISLKFKTMLITGILSFGGICIHMQVYSILSETKIRYKPYLLARILHSLISVFLVYMLY